MRNPTIRLNFDTTFYAILCRSPGLTGAMHFAERNAADASSLDETISDILTGQVECVERVFAWNPVEGTCSDVSEDIALAIAAQLDEPVERDDLRDFIETHCGVGTVLAAAA